MPGFRDMGKDWQSLGDSSQMAVKDATNYFGGTGDCFVSICLISVIGKGFRMCSLEQQKRIASLAIQECHCKLLNCLAPAKFE